MKVYLQTKSQISKELSISLPTIYKLIKDETINEYMIGKKTGGYKIVSLINKKELENIKKY